MKRTFKYYLKLTNIQKQELDKVLKNCCWFHNFLLGQYQTANELVRNYDNVVIENLQINSMLKNHSLAKSIQQARWGILFQVISEAAEIATRGLVRVNPRNTSQTCSDCGELLKEKLTLNQRTFKCWNCELKLDRDVNSARNILNRAILENRFDQHLPLNKENNF